jgi:hypothetical protein
MDTKERDGCTLFFMAIILIILVLTSCKAILYKRDACGNYPVLKKVHYTEPFLSR